MKLCHSTINQIFRINRVFTAILFLLSLINKEVSMEKYDPELDTLSQLIEVHSHP